MTQRGFEAVGISERGINFASAGTIIKMDFRSAADQ